MKAYFAISNGLSGCYMPDCDPVPYAVSKRSELMAIIREAIDYHEFPKLTLQQVQWRRLWGHAKRSGFSVIHFQITHNGYAINFHGLTEAEYEEAANKE